MDQAALRGVYKGIHIWYLESKWVTKSIFGIKLKKKKFCFFFFFFFFLVFVCFFNQKIHDFLAQKFSNELTKKKKKVKDAQITWKSC